MFAKSLAQVDAIIAKIEGSSKAPAPAPASAPVAVAAGDSDTPALGKEAFAPVMSGDLEGVAAAAGATSCLDVTLPAALAPWCFQRLEWPAAGNVILAHYDEENVVVYQAFNRRIAEWNRVV